MASIAYGLDMMTAAGGTDQSIPERRGASPQPSVQYAGLARSENDVISPHVPRQAASKKNRLPGSRRTSSVAGPHADDRELATLMQAVQAGDAGAYARLVRRASRRAFADTPGIVGHG